MTQKVTFNFNPLTAAVVRKHADKLTTTQSEVVRRSIGIFDFLDEQARKGAKIMIRDQDGKERELVFDWLPRNT